MALRGSAARRYAEAAFELARENNTLDAWSADLRTMAEFVTEPDVAGLLNSSRVPRGEKQKLLIAGLQQHVSPLAWNLAKLLEERGRLGLMRAVQEAYQEMADSARGLAHAVVTTAVPLSDEERSAIARQLSTKTGKQVDVTTVVDERIIGGVIARIGDQLIDGSTRTRLVALKRRIASAAG